MMQIIEKVEKELEKLGLTVDTVANDHIIEACVTKVSLEDNLSKVGIDFDQIEKKLYPYSTFVIQMIQHLDEGGSGEDMIRAFLIEALNYSLELRDAFGISLEE